MKVGSLFSGGGLGDFGFMAAGMDIAWQCEIDEYCQKILALRYPDSKKYRDIKTLKGTELEPVDILTGGFPCQPFSVAGKRKGKDDNRYLWPEMLRIIKECRPRWVIGENVVGITNLALGSICSDLEAEGYEVWPVVFPSHALGAWHKRDRIWIICNSEHLRFTPQEITGSTSQRSDNSSTGEKQTSEPSRPSGEQSSLADSSSTGGRAGEESASEGEEVAHRSTQTIPDSESIRIQGLRTSGKQKPDTHGQERLLMCESKGPWESFWDAEPAVGRVANGVADRVHRLKMLGNGQVPACTYVIGKMIMDITANVVKESE